MSDRSRVVPQLLGAAVGIVLGSVLLFALFGMLRDDPSSEVAAAPSPSASPAGQEPTAEPSVTAAPSPAPSATATEAEPEPEPSPEPSPASTEEVDPAGVSIQVLDAVGGEGGAAAAQSVADELRDAGYDVVVVNQAGRDYDVTTVFWSEGQAAGGQQVAATLGTSRAEQTPAEVQLSDAVDVHVVVGADRA